jgi:predicted RNA-binding protein YlxR (DUF448 family)
VARGSELIVDETATLPGRGAWIHPTLDCLTKAQQRHAFGRALRLDHPVDAHTLENRLK